MPRHLACRLSAVEVTTEVVAAMVTVVAEAMAVTEEDAEANSEMAATNSVMVAMVATKTIGKMVDINPAEMQADKEVEATTDLVGEETETTEMVTEKILASPEDTTAGTGYV